MAEIAMFPLGMVLFPHTPLALRVFEERYLVMVGRLLDSDTPEFGTVLIERGQEVGGGDRRFEVGTLAQIARISTGEPLGLVAVGTDRFRVGAWLDDDPYPRAVVDRLPLLEWRDELTALRDDVELAVRSAAADAERTGAARWSADSELSEDPMEASWQLAAMTPAGPLDQLRLLASDSTEELLEATLALARDAGTAVS